uniref:Uncharacterized protein n=1 Tax=Attheya septentrionalis TaxID=420275 RepID=A0A6T7JGE5_9STRA|mmetsp:Transcript_452/g.759  ORF Transcript_452/g.759 Transcript_452/m.759 type:complete len:429 (+) Transcript_452:81-1367(+)
MMLSSRLTGTLLQCLLLLVVVSSTFELANAFSTRMVSKTNAIIGRRIGETGVSSVVRYMLDSDGGSSSSEDEAARLRARAEELREQVRQLEETFGSEPRRPNQPKYVPPPPVEELKDGEVSLRNKRVLVVGANGRVGSMVCRYLLRNHPKTEVVAAVHYVGENSSTQRGYGRLSYEVGAEDGVGTIGPAWSSDDRTSTFEWSEEMRDYNLQNIRIVEAELLDPVQCETICEDVDSVIYCATDFNGNKPRAVSGLNVAFLFRALADPTKGRVEIEGLRNILGGLKASLQSRKWNSRTSSSVEIDYATSSTLTEPSDPTSFVLISTAPGAYKDFETPYGTFIGLKREGEDILKEFPSLTSCVLQMNKYDDNFVEEGLDVMLDNVVSTKEGEAEGSSRRRINRRDAARAAANALVDTKLLGKKVDVWTAER